MQLEVTVRGADGQPQKVPVLVGDGETVGTLRQKLGERGLELLDARRMAETAAAAAPPVRGEPGPTATTTTGTTTTPHPIAEAIGATVGGLIPPAVGLLSPLPGGTAAGVAMRTGGAGSGAVLARTLAEDRLPTPLEAGKTFARGAGAQLGGEAVGGTLGLGARAITGAVRPGMEAATRLRAIIEKPITLGKGGVTVVRDATGKLASLTKLLEDPELLADFAVHPTARETLFKAWWQTVAPEGAASIVQAWKALKPTGQRALAGPMADDMAMLVSGIASGVRGLSVPETLKGMLYGGGILHGLPGARVVAAGDVVRSRLLPAAFASLVPRPAGAAALRHTLAAGDVAGPLAQVLARAGTTGGLAAFLGALGGGRRPQPGPDELFGR